ncbi:MAG: pentapeptide repeat-containing protein [Candidatus Thiodiazotropha sp.]
MTETRFRGARLTGSRFVNARMQSPDFTGVIDPPKDLVSD